MRWPGSRAVGGRDRMEARRQGSAWQHDPSVRSERERRKGEEREAIEHTVEGWWRGGMPLGLSPQGERLCATGE